MRPYDDMFPIWGWRNETMAKQSNPLEKITSIAEVRETVKVDLGDFHESYRGATFAVWVTPTPAHMDKFKEIQRWLSEANEDARKALHRMDAQHREQLARLRDAGRAADVVTLETEYQTERALFDQRCAQKMEEEYDERLLQWIADTCLNWELEELRQARDHLQKTNPLAWEWLWNRITSTIGEYKRAQLKNSGAG